MNLDKNTADYLSRQRWCNFKEEIRLGKVKSIEYDALPFDDGNKLLTIGTIRISSGKGEETRHFMMPLAVAEFDDLMYKDGRDILQINGKRYVDALQRPDYWQKMSKLLRANDGKIIFPNGWTLEYKDISGKDVLTAHGDSSSHPLGVEQSNTTLAVGDDEIAFKLERMLFFSDKTNPEFEMNEKLMREKSTVMPQTYGYLILRNPQNNTMSSSGIVQEFVRNQGDLWNYGLNYLQQRLNEGYLRQRPLTAEDNPHFISLMQNLGQKTAEMSECLSRPDNNSAFTPEPVDERFVYNYRKHLEFLLIKTRNTIQENLENLPEPTKKKAAQLLENWKTLTKDFTDRQIDNINRSDNKGQIVRVHGDFHLGQVMVTKDNDLRFIDFAGEPAAPFEERRQKHISVRDLAGMYRSIKGYLGSVAVEEFVKETPDETTANSRRKYAEKAVKPLIDESARLVLNGRSLKEPWLALEVLRKNLYEVNYEVSNRPQMAYVAVNGLADMLQPENIKTPVNTKSGERNLPE